MKVVYEPRFMDKLRDAKSEAINRGRSIAYVECTEDEALEVELWIAEGFPGHPLFGLRLGAGDEFEILGIKCRVVDDA